MQYFATYYWQDADENTASLVLQQAYHKRRRMPVLLACVCTDRAAHQNGRRIGENLTDWFYGTALPCCGKSGMKGMETAAEKLNKILAQSMKAAETDIAGIFCAGSSFQLFRRGETKIQILNDRNHHTNCRELKMDAGMGKIAVQNGILQRDVGILLSSEGFQSSVPGRIIEECLQVREMSSQSRADTRLRELGSFGEERGGSNMGAVMLVSH